MRDLDPQYVAATKQMLRLRSFARPQYRAVVHGLHRTQWAMRLGASPDFMVVGVTRGGSTALYHYLNALPTVAMSLIKETNFFIQESRYRRGRRWFEAWLPSRLLQRLLGKQADALAGEASPATLFHPEAARRIHAAYPKVRLVVLLREPVARIASLYAHRVAGGHEHLALAEALASEDERLAAVAGYAAAAGAPDETPLLAYGLSYRRHSAYASSLQQFYDVFPREQILPLQSEKLFASDPFALARLFTFLGLAATTPPPFRQRNKSPAMPATDAALAGALQQHFRPHNEALFTLIGERYDWD